jgi:hypothetical protein
MKSILDQLPKMDFHYFLSVKNGLYFFDTDVNPWGKVKTSNYDCVLIESDGQLFTHRYGKYTHTVYGLHWFTEDCVDCFTREAKEDQCKLHQSYLKLIESLPQLFLA